MALEPVERLVEGWPEYQAKAALASTGSATARFGTLKNF